MVKSIIIASATGEWAFLKVLKTEENNSAQDFPGFPGHVLAH